MTKVRHSVKYQPINECRCCHNERCNVCNGSNEPVRYTISYDEGCTSYYDVDPNCNHKWIYLGGHNEMWTCAYCPGKKR